MKTIYDGYLDQWGMVGCNKEPQYIAEATENGLLFTAVALLGERKAKIDLQTLDFKKAFDHCFINGKLCRNPDKPNDSDSHDNYTGAVLGALLSNDREIPKTLLKSLIKNLGVINGAFIGRFPQVWILLLAAANPLLKTLLTPFLYLLYKLQKPRFPLNDTSATQLQLTIVGCLDILYPEKKYLNKWLQQVWPKNMKQVFEIYYSKDHPITKLWS